MSDNGISQISAYLGAALLVTLAIVGVVDVYLSYVYGWPNSVSATIQRWSRQWPVIPLLVGLMLGHLFWPVLPAAVQDRVLEDHVIGPPRLPGGRQAGE